MDLYRFKMLEGFDKISSCFMHDAFRARRKTAVFDFLYEHLSDRVIALDYEKHRQSFIG